MTDTPDDNHSTLQACWIPGLAVEVVDRTQTGIGDRFALTEIPAHTKDEATQQLTENGFVVVGAWKPAADNWLTAALRPANHSALAPPNPTTNAHNAIDRIRDLIDRSSLGTSGARALQRRTPADEVAHIRELVRQQSKPTAPEILELWNDLAALEGRTASNYASFGTHALTNMDTLLRLLDATTQPAALRIRERWHTLRRAPILTEAFAQLGEHAFIDIGTLHDELNADALWSQITANVQLFRYDGAQREYLEQLPASTIEDATHQLTRHGYALLTKWAPSGPDPDDPYTANVWYIH